MSRKKPLLIKELVRRWSPDGAGKGSPQDPAPTTRLESVLDGKAV